MQVKGMVLKNPAGTGRREKGGRGERRRQRETCGKRPSTSFEMVVCGTRRQDSDARKKEGTATLRKKESVNGKRVQRKKESSCGKSLSSCQGTNGKRDVHHTGEGQDPQGKKAGKKDLRHRSQQKQKNSGYGWFPYLAKKLGHGSYKGKVSECKKREGSWRERKSTQEESINRRRLRFKGGGHVLASPEPTQA